MKSRADPSVHTHIPLEVDSNDKWGGNHVWDRGDWGLFSFWTCGFPVKILYPFPLSPRKLIGNIFDKRQHVVNCTVCFSFPYFCLTGSRMSCQKAWMTRKPEQTESQIYQKSWKPQIDSPANIMADRLFVSWQGNNCWDFRMFLGLADITYSYRFYDAPIHWHSYN